MSKNARFSYNGPGGLKTFDAYCNFVQYDFSILSSEAQARIRKAFYTRRLTSPPFIVGLQLQQDHPREGNQHLAYVSWMADYAAYLFKANPITLPTMSVTVTYDGGKVFSRLGIPKDTLRWEDRVGSNVWQIYSTFETVTDDIVGTSSVTASSYRRGYANDPTTQYDNPMDAQLLGTDAPPNSVVNYHLNGGAATTAPRVGGNNPNFYANSAATAKAAAASKPRNNPLFYANAPKNP